MTTDTELLQVFKREVHRLLTAGTDHDADRAIDALTELMQGYEEGTSLTLAQIKTQAVRDWAEQFGRKYTATGVAVRDAVEYANQLEAK